MKALRSGIIVCGSFCLVLFFALPFFHSMRGPAKAMAALVLLVHALGVVVLALMGVAYAWKSRLSPAWVAGSLLLPHFVPLIMALRHGPQTRAGSGVPAQRWSQETTSASLLAPTPAV